MKKRMIYLGLVIFLLLILASFFIYWQNNNIIVLNEEESLNTSIEKVVRNNKKCRDIALKTYKTIKENNSCEKNDDCELVSLDCFLCIESVNKKTKARIDKQIKETILCLDCENIEYTCIPFPITICEKNKCIVKQCDYGNCDECRKDGVCPKM